MQARGAARKLAARMPRRFAVLIVSAALLAALPAAVPAFGPLFGFAIALSATENRLEDSIAAEERAAKAKSLATLKSRLKVPTSDLAELREVFSQEIAPLIPGFRELDFEIAAALALDKRAMKAKKVTQAKGLVAQAIAAKKRALAMIPAAVGAFCIFESSGPARSPYMGNAFHTMNCSQPVSEISIASPVPITGVQGPIVGSNVNGKLTETQMGTCTMVGKNFAKCTLSSPQQPGNTNQSAFFVDVFVGVPSGTVIEALVRSPQGQFQITKTTAR